MKPYIETKLPIDFEFTPAQAAKKLGVGVQVVRRNIARKPTEQHYLKSHQHSPNGSITIYVYDLEDYLIRTQQGVTREEISTLQKAV